MLQIEEKKNKTFAQLINVSKYFNQLKNKKKTIHTYTPSINQYDT